MLMMLSGKTVRGRFLSVIKDFSKIFEVSKKDLILSKIIIHGTIILSAADGLRIRALMITGLKGGIWRVNKVI